jgi:hypothetical protein
MWFRCCWSLAAVAAGFLVGGQSLAAGTAQFSARVIQTGPQGAVSEGTMYVAPGHSRMDVVQSGRRVVNIVDQERGLSWTLFPDQKSYLEHKAPPQVASVQPGGSPLDPCRTIRDAECRSLGDEEMAGRGAEKWEIRFTQGGKILTGTQWIDKERHMPLRTDMPGGAHAELHFLGPETLGGRQVEKWESVSTRGGMAPVRSFQWYDPKLDLAVRQQLPGGYSSELKDIRVEPQPETLFQVPSGYERVSLPPPGLSQEP